MNLLQPSALLSVHKTMTSWLDNTFCTLVIFLWQGVKTFPRAHIPLMGCPLCYTKWKEHVCEKNIQLLAPQVQASLAPVTSSRITGMPD